MYVHTKELAAAAPDEELDEEEIVYADIPTDPTFGHCRGTYTD